MTKTIARTAVRFLFTSTMLVGPSWPAYAGINVKRFAFPPETPTGWRDVPSDQVFVDGETKTITFESVYIDGQYWIYSGTGSGPTFTPDDIKSITSTGSLDGRAFSITIVAPGSLGKQYVGVPGARDIGTSSEGGISLSLTRASINGLSQISGNCRRIDLCDDGVDPAGTLSIQVGQDIINGLSATRIGDVEAHGISGPVGVTGPMNGTIHTRGDFAGTFTKTGTLVSTGTIRADGSITGPITFAGPMNGTIRAYGNIDGTISITSSSASTGTILADGSITGTMTTAGHGSYNGTITASSISSTGAVHLASGSATIHAPTIAGNITVDTGFTGAIEANGLTPQYALATWSVNPSCGWYVKNLSGGGDRVLVATCPPSKAAGPSPGSSTGDVLVWRPLWWTAGAGATAHDVYLGTSPSTLEYKGRTSDTYFNPVNLKPSTPCYWRVDEVNAGGITTGDVWSFTTAAAPTVLRVDGSTNYANPTGASWTSCFSNLQAALNAVGSGNANHEIWIAQGTYKPSAPSGRSATFVMRSGVAIYGGFPHLGGDGTFGARMPAQYITTLSGDLAGNDLPNFTNYGENSYHVVTASGVDATAVLDGVTVLGGYANGTTAERKHGGGVYGSAGAVQLRRCTFQANWAPDASAGMGGGVFLDDSIWPGARVTGCMMQNNKAQSGAGLYCHRSSADGLNPDWIVGCTVKGNTAAGFTGGIACYNATTNIVNCLVCGNVAANGGGIVTAYGSPRIVNCTIAANTGNSQAGGLYAYESDGLAISNCIIYANSSPIAAGIFPTSGLAVTYCDVQDGYSGGSAHGNISSLPKFVSARAGNFRLSADSPCINAGSPDNDDKVPPQIRTDIDGFARKLAAGGIYAGVVDLGAYEYSGFPRYDQDHDGDVDQADFARIQACYAGSGLGASRACLDPDADGNGLVDIVADLDGDGLVNGTDERLFAQQMKGPSVPATAAFAGWGRSSDPDGDEDGVPDAIDNCPTVYNPDQANADGDAWGDMCDACPAEAGVINGCPMPAPPPPDTDQDGVPNATDNCPTVANADQYDWDQDGVGNACDNCLFTPNADQADPDADDMGTACDNCPTVANLGQEDSDWDGIGDACETDDDNDGVLDAQDNCPTAFNPSQIDRDGDGAGDECDTCPTVSDPGQSNQDGDYWQDACDNCPTVWNYNQQDTDGDHVGNVCDNCPTVSNPDQADTDQDGIGDACEGEGLMGGGEMQMMMMGEEGSQLDAGGVSSPAPQAIASFVQHGTGALFVALPPQGGTVVVDLLIAATEPVGGFSAKPAVSASGVVSVDSSGWTEQANALFSLGDPSTTLPSYYNLGVIQWMVAIPSVAALDQTPRPSGTGAETGRSLVQLTGAYAGEAFGISDGLDLLTGPISVPAGNGFTTSAPMSGCLTHPVSNGAATVVTLTLQVAGVPGTYTLGVTDGTCSTETGETPMTTGVPFTISVGE